MERVEKGSTTMSFENIILSGQNATHDLREVNPDNHVSVVISQVKNMQWGTSAEKGINYYFNKTSEPYVRRFENSTGVDDITDRVEVNITEEGHWYLVIENPGNWTVSYYLDLEWVEHTEIPLLESWYLTRGLLLVIYSVLFIAILAIRDRVKKERGKEISEKKGEKSKP